MPQQSWLSGKKIFRPNFPVEASFILSLGDYEKWYIYRINFYSAITHCFFSSFRHLYCFTCTLAMFKKNLVQVYRLQKGGVFSEDSLPYLWKWNVHATFQINRTDIGNVPPKAFLRTALSPCFFGNRIGRTVICHGITKGRLPFSHKI